MLSGGERVSDLCPGDWIAELSSFSDSDLRGFAIAELVCWARSTAGSNVEAARADSRKLLIRWRYLSDSNRCTNLESARGAWDSA